LRIAFLYWELWRTKEIEKAELKSAKNLQMYKIGILTAWAALVIWSSARWRTLMEPVDMLKWGNTMDTMTGTGNQQKNVTKSRAISDL
jgi:hypothetical protein